MVAFTTTLQADLSGTAFAGTPTWTDLTRFARLKASPVTLNAWRQDELSDVAPSTATIVLDNADVPGDATAPNAGRFTPDLATSPFYPRIVPGVRMRFGVTVNAVTYWLIDGYVDSWDASALDGEFPICTVVINDILAEFGTTTPLQALYVEELLLDTPTCYYPCTETVGVAAVGDVSGNQHSAAPLTNSINGGTIATGYSDSVPMLAGVDTVAALRVTSPTQDAGGFIAMPSDVTAAAWAAWPVTFEMIVKIDSTAGNSLVWTTLGPGNPCYVNVLSFEVFIQFGDATRSATCFRTGNYIGDGKWHHLMWGMKADAVTPFLYVDGNAASSTTPAASALALPSRSAPMGFGGEQYPGISGWASGWTGAFGQCAVYAGVDFSANATRRAAHVNAFLNGFAGEATDVHINRLLSYRADLGATLDAGKGTVGPQATNGVTLQQALLTTGKAEGGVVYADGASKIVLRNRGRLRNPAVAATLDVTAQQTTGELSVRKDRQQVINDATIARPGGATQRVNDATSINANGPRVKSDTLVVATDQDALNAAGWLVSNGKTPRSRLPLLVADLLTEPSLTVAAAVLSLAPLSRVSLINAPSWLPATDVIVQGVSWTVGVDVFTAAFFTSPLPRPTLRFDASADAFTKLDNGNVFAW